MSKIKNPKQSKEYESSLRKIGFLSGKATIPEDFDTLFSEEIAEMFKGMFDNHGEKFLYRNIAIDENNR